MTDQICDWCQQEDCFGCIGDVICAQCNTWHGKRQRRYWYLPVNTDELWDHDFYECCDGCWLWPGQLADDGIAMVTVDYRQALIDAGLPYQDAEALRTEHEMPVCRYLYRLPENLEFRMFCGNPGCIRITHTITIDENDYPVRESNLSSHDHFIRRKLQDDPAFRKAMLRGLIRNAAGLPAYDNDESSPTRRISYARDCFARYGDLLLLCADD